MTEGARRGASAGRMEALATLPVFFKLQGLLVVMAGGDLPAVWKAELLAAAGAHVRVIAAAPCPEMLALVAALPSGAIELVDRAWTPADLDGVAMAIGAIENEDEAEHFRQSAKRAGVPVNVIDKPAFCDFQFGTVVARSPLVIGISTDGAAPVFGQALRARIEAVLPQGLRRWAQAAKDWRPAVQARNLDFRRRRRFWETFTARALESPDSTPSSQDQDACFAALDGMAASDRARLFFVGAGRGDANCLTLAAIAALQAADVVLFDPDVGATAVGLARREALKVAAAPDMVAIPSEVAADLAQGRTVVWLGTGNPACCRRWLTRVAAMSQGVLTIVEGLSACPQCAGVCGDVAAERLNGVEEAIQV